jgi:RNA polymerase sigma-70 factor (ECF subfamily)
MDVNEFGQDLSDDSPVVAASEPFEVFFRHEYRSVLGLAFVLCGDRAVAEELTMEGFEASLRDWSRVSQLESPGAWVRKVVSNSSVSRFRRLAVEARARARLSARDYQGGLDEGGNVEVWEAVRRLPRRQRQVVALFYVEGFTRSETGQLLGISEESVKTHLDRARQRLGRELDDHADG